MNWEGAPSALSIHWRPFCGQASRLLQCFEVREPLPPLAANMESTTSLQPDPPGFRREQADGSVVFFGTALRLRVAALKPGFVLITALGEALTERDMRAEQGMIAELDRELEQAGQLTVFADLRESPRMPAASRDLIANWLRRHQVRLNTSHVLVHSKIMEIAMSVVAMLVGGGMVKVYSKADVFLGLVRKAAPKLPDMESELPSVPGKSDRGTISHTFIGSILPLSKPSCFNALATSLPVSLPSWRRPSKAPMAMLSASTSK